MSRHAGNSITGTTVSKQLKGKASNSRAIGMREVLCTTMVGAVNDAQTKVDLKQHGFATLSPLTRHLPEDSDLNPMSGVLGLKVHLKVLGCLHCRVFIKPKPFSKGRTRPTRKASQSRLVAFTPQTS